MKFGKHIQAHQVPGWSAYYLDYKFLKKIISSLVANRPASEAAALAVGVRPTDILSQETVTPTTPQPQSPLLILEDASGQPPIFPASEQDGDRGPDFHAHKAAFFFKLERELEKINAFYLQKEAGLKLRLETLLSKRRAAATRGLPNTDDGITQNHVEWSAVEEGFRLLQRDLGKLQQFIEINAMGFRKILKKWDKRSTSSTKELYLARQVDVQPVFNRQLISELSDTVTTCLIDLTDLTSGLKFEGRAANEIFTQQINSERTAYMGPFNELENNLRKAVASGDEVAIKEVLHYSDVLAQENGGKTNVTRILWRIVIEAPPELADVVLSSVASPFDFAFIDDINGRTCLHEAAIAGSLRLVDICLANGVQTDKIDVYGRSPLHYAAMNGHPDVCQRLLGAGLPPNTVDMDNYSPLIYATLRGSVDCMRTLIQKGHVEAHPSTPIGDLIPLSLASQSGHVEVVLLLLQNGARCVPNSNGEYPMHLAAREGHPDICGVLLGQEGWDTRDKYHEWTPLFHAARNGREECIRILLEAGCRYDPVDEVGHLAVHYAAWYGHHAAVDCLVEAAANLPTGVEGSNIPEISPSSDMGRSPESEIDQIPSFSLPPPIMPHRVYGHNYLDKTCLVQVSLGHWCTSSGLQSAVRLHPRLVSPASKDKYLLASTPLKLVMTSPDVNSAPYCISLPQQDEKGVFAFQIPTLDALSLEFSIYPNFGTKTIGRAVALPALFKGIYNNQAFVLPVLDHRLHVIGEVRCEVNIVSPFDGVTLEVGGDVETYWKSPAMPPSSVTSRQISSRWTSLTLGSAHTSPSSHSLASSAAQAFTVSSLRGSYLYIVIQVTRDLHPVVYADWTLPESNYRLGVADVTLEQFEALARRLHRDLNLSAESPSLHAQASISDSMVSLSRLIKILPATTGLCLDLAYPSARIVEQYLGRRLDLNSFVDSVLRSIYRTCASLSGNLARRKIVFTSFNPDACAALNWKQPNYPVFFGSFCGKKGNTFAIPTVLSTQDDVDRRLGSLGAAVEFSTTNNLLGVFLDADLLLRVPSLMQGIRNAGLLVAVFGASEALAPSNGNRPAERNQVDAVLRDDCLVVIEHELL